MKKTALSFLLLCIYITACNDAEQLLSPEGTSYHDNEYTSAEIVNIANEIAEELDCPASRSQKRVANATEIYSSSYNISRSESSNLKIVNYNDNQGFAIISKYRIPNPVIAIINEGHYTPDIEIDNPGFNMYISSAEDYVQAMSDSLKLKPDYRIPADTLLITDGKIPATKYKEVIDTLQKIVIPSKIQDLKWGQKYPCGMYCPNSICGCAPLAMAMIIVHYSPSSNILFFDYPSCDISYDTYDWNAIRAHKYYNGLQCCSDEIHSKIGRLCRQIGHVANSSYGLNSTGTNPGNYKSTLQKYLPSNVVSNLKSYEYNAVVNSLNYGLVMMRGNSYNVDTYGNKLPTGDGEGHAWVADGCYYYKISKKIYHKNYDDSDWVYESTSISEKKLLSFNWGWQGSDNSTSLNGYYYDMIFNPKKLDGKRFFECQYIEIK